MATITESPETATRILKADVDRWKKVQSCYGESSATVFTRILDLVDTLLTVNQPNETLNETLDRLVNNSQVAPLTEFDALLLPREGEGPEEWINRLKSYKEKLSTLTVF